MQQNTTADTVLTLDSSGREARDVLTEIADGKRKVNDLAAEIAAANNEQSQGIEQINQAVTQMDQVTQSSARKR